MRGEMQKMRKSKMIRWQVRKEQSRIYQSALGVYETLYLHEHGEHSSLYPACQASCADDLHFHHCQGAALVCLNHSVFSELLLWLVTHSAQSPENTHYTHKYEFTDHSKITLYKCAHTFLMTVK